MYLSARTSQPLIFILFLSQVVAAILLGVALATDWGKGIVNRDILIFGLFFSGMAGAFLGRHLFETRYLSDLTIQRLVVVLFLSQVVAAILLGVALATGFGKDVVNRDILIFGLFFSGMSSVLLGRQLFR